MESKEDQARKKAQLKIKQRNMEIIYGRKAAKGVSKSVPQASISRSMSYAEGRFGKAKNDSDDSFGEDEDIMAKSMQSRRGGALSSKTQNQQSSDDEKDPDQEHYEFPNIVSIGQMSFETRLTQILEQLDVPYKEYLWWNSSNKIKLTIPPELYEQNDQASTTGKGSINVGKAALQQHRSKSVAVKQETSLLNHKEPRIMLTRDHLILFYIKQDKLKKKDANEEEEKFDYIGVQLAQQVEVKDVQKYSWMDFEFIQKVKDLKQAFNLQIYNKEMSKVDMPFITIECFKQEDFFIINHFIEKQMPGKWQEFFERELQMNAPDCYQFHSFITKWNRFNQAQPRFFVLSLLFLYNTECGFDKNGDIVMKENKWMLPIQAINLITMTEIKDKRIDLEIFMDAKYQTDVLQKHGLKKVSKVQREVSFSISRRTMCRDFLWHLKRIHHWWNCGMKEGLEANRKPLEIKDKKG